MKRILYASNKASDLDNIYGEEFANFRRVSECELIITPGIGLPRNLEMNFFKPQNVMPDNIFKIVTFADATDMRARELASKFESGPDLPIVVYWSGGIDSTVMLAAIIKNWSRELVSNLHIKMTNASYAENPLFFNKLIKGKIKHSDKYDWDYNNSQILHGDPADALWLGGNILTFRSEYGCSPNALLSNARETVIKYFTKESNDPILAEWLYENIFFTAGVSGFELRTVSDLFWWMIFNYNYSVMCLKHIGEAKVINIENYQKNFNFWYNTEDYQAWSVNAQINGDKYDGSIRSYKMPAKDYIYTIDGNQHFRDFKTKMHSNYLSISDMSKIKVLYEDYTYELG